MPFFTPEQERRIADKFWSNIVFEDSDGCWLWAGKISKSGMRYGTFACRGLSLYAHRMAWLLSHGPIPDALHVLHACDKPLCVNPQHLSLGTQAENMRQMVERGRYKPNLAGRKNWSTDQREEAKRRYTPEVRAIYSERMSAQWRQGRMRPSA